jgi:imidazolonepropionase-like amidohydrolase
MRLPLALLATAVCASAQPLAITHVTLIDTVAGRALPEMTVVISGDRITAVGAAKSVKVPRGAQVLDGRGKFLIPGLWDMHAHLFATLPLDPNDPAPRDFFVPLLVSSGITGVRSMWDDPGAIRRLRASPGVPRIISCGPIVDGPQPYLPGSIACANAQQGRDAVRRLKADGVDFIKVYSWLPRDVYFAIAREARAVGIPFAGHVPNSITLEEASDAGQKSFEHLMGMDSVDPQKAPALFAKFVQNGTWQTPTLTALRGLTFLNNPERLNDPRISSLPPLIQQYWKSGGAGVRSDEETFQRQLALVAAMHRAGVKILAGTDTPNPFVFPGTSLHDELALLVDAGFTPLQSLQSATIRPAEYLGMTDRLGSVAPGKFADLVLLDADPLTDIANTRRIAAVVLNGKLQHLDSAARPGAISSSAPSAR